MTGGPSISLARGFSLRVSPELVGGAELFAIAPAFGDEEHHGLTVLVSLDQQGPL
ncbi:MAG: hypothetical protein WB771_04355 [Solirubrobacterales bacterium]